MTPDRDPPRLLDQSSGLLRDALQDARRDLPSPAQIDAIAGKLAAKVALGPPAAAGIPIYAKIGAVACAAAVGAAMYVTGSPNVALNTLTHAPQVIELPELSATAQTNDKPDVASAATVTAPATSVRSSPSASAHPKHGATQLSTRAESEVDLLRRAQDTLSSNPAEALAITQKHATLYRSGALAQEREVIAIDALLRLGRKAEARSRADRFEAAFPHSSHIRRINALVGKTESNAGSGR